MIMNIEINFSENQKNIPYAIICFSGIRFLILIYIYSLDKKT